MAHISFYLKFRERLRQDKSQTNSMHLVFYNTSERDKRKDKEEQEILNAEYPGFHRLRTLQILMHLKSLDQPYKFRTIIKHHFETYETQGTITQSQEKYYMVVKSVSYLRI